MFDLRPSASHRWTVCHAMPRLAANIPPEPEGDEAREGTCAAWVAEMVLTGEVAKASDLVDSTHENGWIVTADMAHLIQAYCDVIVSRGGEIHTERKIRLNEMIAGTPDAFAVVTERGELFVDDLKYGYRIVEPYQNPQVAIYAGAIVRMLAGKVVLRKISIGIYQPRPWHPAGHHRTWELYPEQLMKFVHWIEEQGVACQNPSALATPGGHCEYCPAAATCPSLAHSVYDHMTMVRRNDQGTMNPEQIARELEFLDTSEKILKARRNAVRTEATARVQRGESIPGWHLEHPLGDRQFKVGPEVIRAMTGIDPYQRKPKTVAAIEREGANSTLIAALSYRPNRPPVLKPIPDGYFDNLFKSLKGK